MTFSNLAGFENNRRHILYNPREHPTNNKERLIQQLVTFCLTTGTFDLKDGARPVSTNVLQICIKIVGLPGHRIIDINDQNSITFILYKSPYPPIQNQIDVRFQAAIN